MSWDAASLRMVPAQQQPPNSLVRAVSGFRAGSPARGVVIYKLQNPSAQKEQDQDVTVRRGGREGTKEEGNEEKGTRCWKSQARTGLAESCAVI